MSTTTICAWCQSEAGIPHMPGASHGICPRHRASMLRELRSLELQMARGRGNRLGGRLRQAAWTLVLLAASLILGLMVGAIAAHIF